MQGETLCEKLTTMVQSKHNMVASSSFHETLTAEYVTKSNFGHLIFSLTTRSFYFPFPILSRVDFFLLFQYEMLEPM